MAMVKEMLCWGMCDHVSDLDKTMCDSPSSLMEHSTPVRREYAAMSSSETNREEQLNRRIIELQRAL